MRSFDMDEFATYFIKYRTEEKDAQTIEHITLMKQCYRFLIKFVRGNVQNQQKLREDLEDYLKDIEKHSLAIMLVFEIFRDNKKFLNLNASKILK
jgi:RIH domain